MIYFIIFIILLFLIVYYSKHFLLILLLLEFITFAVILIFVTEIGSLISITDAIVVSLFAVFVIEGVIALSLLIILVSFSGADYLRVKNFLKL